MSRASEWAETLLGRPKSLKLTGKNAGGNLAYVNCRVSDSGDLQLEIHGAIIELHEVEVQKLELWVRDHFSDLSGHEKAEAKVRETL